MFWKSQACGQTELPDRSFLTWWKLPKIKKKIQMRNIWVICGHTVLPDRSILIGQKLAENANIQMWHFSDIQTTKIK